MLLCNSNQYLKMHLVETSLAIESTFLSTHFKFMKLNIYLHLSYYLCKCKDIGIFLTLWIAKNQRKTDQKIKKLLLIGSSWYVVTGCTCLLKISCSTYIQPIFLVGEKREASCGWKYKKWTVVCSWKFSISVRRSVWKYDS